MLKAKPGLSVRFAAGYGDEDLACPGCGEGYLHHVAVRVFNRRTEDAPTAVTSIPVFDYYYDGMDAASGPSADARDYGNPSSRRGGVAIAFKCELCPWEGELTLAQHKGCSELAWRTTKNPAG